MAEMASTRVPFMVHPHLIRDAGERAQYQAKIDELAALPQPTNQESEYLAYAQALAVVYDAQ